jgi:Bacterial Ig-like domain (group 3)
VLPTKSRARVTVALATVVALAASAVAVQQMMPGSAVASAPATRAFVAPPNLLQGVVLDQAGRPVDDVEVEAVGADGGGAAADKTYASKRHDGPQHGYFYLFVPRGSYTLVLSKPGYRTVEHEAGQITKRRKTISMGEIEIQRIPAPTTTLAAPVKARISTKESGSVAVTVKGDGKVVGDVEVREGRRVVGEATIGKSAKGAVTVTLDRLAPGDHQLTAYFLGTADHKASSSRQLTLEVIKKRR